MEAIQTKVETLTKERETVISTLQKLKTDYELNTRNLDRIDGALFILREQLEDMSKEVKECKSESDCEVSKEITK